MGDVMNYLINMATSISDYHQHNEYEIVICTTGDGVFSCTEDIPVCRGSIAIVPPKASHKFYNSGTLERIYIRGDFNHLFSLTEPVVLQDNPEQEGLMLANMLYKYRFASQEYLAALIDAYMHHLMQSVKTEDRLHMAITQIIDGITNNFYDYHIDLKSILEGSGYAEDYIRAQFKKATGKTPNEFLTHVRIRHACFLIDIYGNVMPLSEIADKCGYTDYVYFSKKFKAITGVPPRQYVAETFACS